MRLQLLTVSIVIYNTPHIELHELFSMLKSQALIKSWVVIDNGSSDEVRDSVKEMGGIYIRTGKNVGFGSGHNLALRCLESSDTRYHLILNPDIILDGTVLERLVEVMDSRPDVGLLMPRVVYPDGSNQYLCKLLPAPIDLLLRRFLPAAFTHLAKGRISTYALRHLDYDSPAYVPSLSGCFMFVRQSVLRAVGGFDERFFLYMEDVDLCRRIAAVARLLYWPGVTVKHIHQMGSYRSRKLLIVHIKSAIKYFNKWGWIFDKSRKRINRMTLAAINEFHD